MPVKLINDINYKNGNFSISKCNSLVSKMSYVIIIGLFFWN